jgi:hypothetical protein
VSGRSLQDCPHPNTTIPWGQTMTTFDPQDLAARYIALWIEPDSRLRRETIHRLWAEDGTHILQPPVEIREAAAELGFGSTVLEARGHDAVETRVTRSFERFVASGQFTFRAGDNAVRLHDIVKFSWETVSVDDGKVAGGGLEILVLDEDHRIKTDYMLPSA